METPASYVTHPDSVTHALEAARVGQVSVLGRSPGGREVHAVSYGTFESIDRQANLSAAMSADQPEAFYGKGRDKQVLLIAAGIHGAEMESIAAVLHLISILETGRDLDGVEWPQLTADATRLRLVIVPLANPDGRARIDADDPLLWTEAQKEKYRHGLNAQGQPNGWMPGCFTPHPRPPGHDAFLGGYFNDAGVNPSHGVFLDRRVAPETHILADLAEAETADCFLDLHSCSAGPFFISGYPFITDRLTQRQSYVDGAWRTRMRQHDLPAPEWTTQSKRQIMGLEELVYHRAGSLPLLFEGGSGSHYTGDNIHRQIVETYLLLFETVCRVGVEEGGIR